MQLAGRRRPSCPTASCGSTTRSSRQETESGPARPDRRRRPARARRGHRRGAGARRRGRRRDPDDPRDRRRHRAASSASSTASAGSAPARRISFGLLLDEQAERAPDDVVLLFEDRAHTHTAVKDRVDNVVRGLLEIGVHQGEHVGVLMQTRPSALTVVAALNRLGAVAVLMRPDGDPGREAELGKARRIVADPQNAEARRRGERPAGLRARRRRRGPAARARPGRHGADRPRRRPGAGLVPCQPGPGRRPRVHPLHRQRRAHARQPDHQPALGALGVRHRVLGGADAAATRSTRPRPSTTPRRC